MEALYQERAERLYKLLDKYLDKRYLPSGTRALTAQAGLLHVSIHEAYHGIVTTFLRDVLECKVTQGKDRFGRNNGYLVISLDTQRLNITGFFQAALALERMSGPAAVEDFS